MTAIFDKFHIDTVYVMFMVAFLNGYCEAMEFTESECVDDLNKPAIDQAIEQDASCDETQQQKNKLYVHYGDRLQLIVKRDYIIGCLWRGEEVFETDIEIMIESLCDLVFVKNCYAKRDGLDDVEAFLSVIESVFLEYGGTSINEEKYINNIKDFMHKIKTTEKKHGLLNVKRIMYEILDIYG